MNIELANTVVDLYNAVDKTNLPHEHFKLLRSAYEMANIIILSEDYTDILEKRNEQV